MADKTPTPPTPVYVIGGGPGGLATAAALGERGVRAVVVEKGHAVAGAWRTHYDRLQLHTTRRMSALPGLAIPRSYGRWVGRDNLVRYLEQYVERHQLECVTGVAVSRIERAPADGPAAGNWVLHATGGRELTAPAVVVATGYHHAPHLPEWPGLTEYAGEVLHAAEYRDAGPYRGKDVLVVGAGNSGAEIATDLADGGAGRVRWAVRTPPHIVRRSRLGWSAQRSAVLARRMPVGVMDHASAARAKFCAPDLAEHGLPRPASAGGAGLYSRARAGAIPVRDAGIVRAVRAGRVEVVAAVESFDGDKPVLVDGSRIDSEVVIAATGYRPGLDQLVGHLDVLDAHGRPRVHGARSLATAPGLHFTGYTNPVSGMLRELGIDARKIAKRVSRELR
ncbi:flavin-containing monooxygenase [Streptomyces zagrosensis]|uniref:Putative flavoprotein involved in K+ transport n=1 Tax=Streptomyces zagrosensis TaxID=1042984 RepID=A0A7W9V261_9ACTN|nr:NAD(P)/FAD-dependent oxidoreductase [Streptomyces zagrosensis]MBB5939632.1 putative flavoprotein involved in K+ transport [Streptomyces zagrosensis]